MTKSHHTPGPWEVLPAQWDEGETLCIQTASIGDVVAFIEGPANERDYANARLIAAAPELLDALEGLLNLNDVKQALNSKSHDVRKSHAKALAAIAKARGENAELAV